MCRILEHEDEHEHDAPLTSEFGLKGCAKELRRAVLRLEQVPMVVGWYKKQVTPAENARAE